MARARCRGGGPPVLAAIAAAVLAPACLADRQGADGESCAEDEEAPCMQVGMLQKGAQMLLEGNATRLPMAAEGGREDVGLGRAASAEPSARIGLGALQLLRHAAAQTAASSSMVLLIVVPLVLMLMCCCCRHCCHRFGGGFGGYGYGGQRGKGRGKGEWDKDYYDDQYDTYGVPPPPPTGTEPVTVPPAGHQAEPRPVREGKGYGKDKDKWDRRDQRRNW